MNGAQALVQTLLSSGVEACFANPGTSEMHFVAALDQSVGMKCTLGLHENVVTGMADGYFRVARKPACTLLHCGPGLANGLANLHNARRASSGIVNIVGDQATYHRQYDAPLTSDTESLARAVSGWVCTSSDAADVGADAARAVQAANAQGGQVATLILPSDASWSEGGIVVSPLLPIAPAPIEAEALEACAALLRSGKKVLILLGGNALTADCQEAAWRIAKASNATILAEYSPALVARGCGRPQLERIPYSIDLAVERLKSFEGLITVNAKAPVSFFAYPGKPSVQYAPGTQIASLSDQGQDPLQALNALADELRAPAASIPDPGSRPTAARGVITSEGVAQTLAALMPENAIVSDESISFGRNFYPFSHAAPPHDWLHLTGGAIGDGLPVATGAAIAAGGRRRVISLQADGSALYTVQALWTQAREKLPCTTIILSNRKYNILIGEYKNVGAKPGQTAMSMLDLSDPNISWVSIAKGFGVEAASASSLKELADLLAHSFSLDAPFVIELQIF